MIRPATVAIVLLATEVGGCGYTPEQLGITGPGTAAVAFPSHASETDMDAVIQPPGLPGGYGGSVTPSMVPTYGTNGRYFGYN